MSSVKLILTNGFSKKLNEVDIRLKEGVKKELAKFVFNTAAEAKKLSPKNDGELQNGIQGEMTGDYSGEISARAPHSAYMEFGTGKRAAQYVSSLPGDWKTYAASFKGKGGGSFDDMIRRLTEWVRKKGIAGTYSVKTRRRTGNKAKRKDEDRAAAYAIAISILKNGVNAQPYLYPAYRNNRKKFLDNVRNILKQL